MICDDLRFINLMDLGCPYDIVIWKDVKIYGFGKEGWCGECHLHNGGFIERAISICFEIEEDDLMFWIGEERGNHSFHITLRIYLFYHI